MLFIIHAQEVTRNYFINYENHLQYKTLRHHTSKHMSPKHVISIQVRNASYIQVDNHEHAIPKEEVLLTKGNSLNDT